MSNPEPTSEESIVSILQLWEAKIGQLMNQLTEVSFPDPVLAEIKQQIYWKLMEARMYGFHAEFVLKGLKEKDGLSELQGE